MLRIAIALLAIASALARAIPAQVRPPARAARTGFWWGFGLAPGWARVSCAICGGRREAGVSAMVRLGGGVGPDLRIGAEVAAWRRDDGTVGQTLTSVSAAAYWYPRPRSRFYLKGGVGYVTHRASDGTDVITSTGFGPQFGIGQEYAFGRKWTFAPFINYALGSVGGGVKFNGGQAADRATVSFLQVGLGLTRP